MTLARAFTWIVVGGLALVGGLWWIVARLVEPEETDTTWTTTTSQVSRAGPGTVSDGSFFDGRRR